MEAGQTPVMHDPAQVAPEEFVSDLQAETPYQSEVPLCWVTTAGKARRRLPENRELKSSSESSIRKSQF